MIVDRRVFIAKKGRSEDAVAVAKQIAEAFGATFPDATYRLYRPSVAAFDSLAWEGEWESLAAWEKGQAEFFSLPEAVALLEKWNEVSETCGTHEIWEVVE